MNQSPPLISATMPAFQITVVELFFCSPSDEQRGSQQNEGGRVGKMSSISSHFPRPRSFHSVWPTAASEMRMLQTEAVHTEHKTQVTCNTTWLLASARG